MRRHACIALLCLLIVSSIAAQAKKEFETDVKTEQKPWTHLNFANDPDNFQFAIVTDRTGSPRAGIFEDAIRKLNWLMPEFVMSVGDLIRGAKGMDSVRLAQQWEAHFERIKPLKMPFFHLAGNHDIKANNAFQVEYWNKLFGVPFYSFKYKNVLFLGLFTNEGTQTMTDEQIAYFEQVLKENQDVRWTMVFMHHPLWRYTHESNFDKMEALLKERNYTIFAGHQHRYHHTERQKSNYYVLATTGGGSGLLGNSFGMFDHITWVTMTDEGPVLANIRLDGILPHDVANEESHALSRALINSVFFEANVLTNEGKEFTKGKAYLTFKNHAELPLYLDAQLFHHHYIRATPGKISVKIPAGETKTIALDLEAIEPFELSNRMKLELEASLGFNHPDYPDLKLTGVKSIEIKTAEYPLLPTTSAEFDGSYSVNFSRPLPETEIRYTLDGTVPNAESTKLTGSLVLDEKADLKARLFHKDGLVSEVDELVAIPTKWRKGVRVEYYELDGSKGTIERLPDFLSMAPQAIKFSQTLDPARNSEKDQLFGLVYKGAVKFPKSGAYEFSLTSDDAAALFIDGKRVAADLIKHKARETKGVVELSKGEHLVEIHYFQFKRDFTLKVEYTLPGGEVKQLTADQFQKPQKTKND